MHALTPGGGRTAHDPTLTLIKISACTEPLIHHLLRLLRPARLAPASQVHAREAGIRAVVFNSRGTSGSPVLTAQFYSASFTGDMR